MEDSRKDKESLISLNMVSPGKEVTVVSITGGRHFRQRLIDMGLAKGTCLRVLQSNRPGPCVIRLGESRLALGHGMCTKILVKEKEV